MPKSADGQASTSRAAVASPRQRNPRKFAKWTLLEPPQHPQTRKLCGKRTISIIFSINKKKYFFENDFFAIFLGFFDSSKQGFSRSGRPGDVSVPTNKIQCGVGGTTVGVSVIFFAHNRFIRTAIYESGNTYRALCCGTCY